MAVLDKMDYLALDKMHYQILGKMGYLVPDKMDHETLFAVEEQGLLPVVL
jgi:hypothetical protein